MADLRIVDAPVLLQESITDDVKMPTGGLGNFSVRLGDILWYVITKEQLANKSYVDLSSKGVKDSLDEHIADKANPHNVTKAQVGLGNVDNTADIDKPVSNAVSSAIITATTDMATKTEIDTNYGGVKTLYDKNVAAGAGENGWAATLIADASGMTQQQVNDKTALFYNTVADMVADTKLKAGKAVITHGYYAPNDGGGARYLIKDVATDYSIPVANNLHAVFADSFDVLKFGIRDNKDLEQGTELNRLVAYVDKYCYEVDFKNFAIRVPATVQFITDRGTTVRGLGFNKVHHIKNLNLVVNKSITQEAGLCPLGFYPKSKGDCTGIFKLTNFVCDAQLTNFGVNSGEFDSMFVGFLAKSHPEWNYSMWKVENVETIPIEFEIDNVNFKTPSMSYNMSIADWKSKRISISNLSGDYVGLYAAVFADKLFVDNVDATYRKDLHTTDPTKRQLVTSAIHQEPELGETGSASISLIDVKNVKVRDTDGNIGLGFWNWSQGKLTIDTVKFTNMDSYCNFSRAYSYRGSIINLTADNVAGLAVVFDVTNLNVKNSPIKKFQTANLRPDVLTDNYLLNASTVNNLTLSNCKIEKICTDYNEATVIKTLNISGGEVSSNDYILVLLAQVQLNVKDLDTLDSTKFIRVGLANAKVDGLKSSALAVNNFMFDELSDGSPINLRNLYFVATSGPILNGANAISISNSSISTDIVEAFLRKSALKLNTTHSKPLVFTVDSISVPTGMSTKDFVVPSAKEGDMFIASSMQNLQGCTLSCAIIGDSTLRIYLTNNAGATITLSNVNFLIEPIFLS